MKLAVAVLGCLVCACPVAKNDVSIQGVEEKSGFSMDAAITELTLPPGGTAQVGVTVTRVKGANAAIAPTSSRSRGAPARSSRPLA